VGSYKPLEPVGERIDENYSKRWRLPALPEVAY